MIIFQTFPIFLLTQELKPYNFKMKISEQETFSFKLITYDEIMEFLHSIKTKAVRADGLSINMILYCYPFILPYLTYI